MITTIIAAVLISLGLAVGITGPLVDKTKQIIQEKKEQKERESKNSKA